MFLIVLWVINFVIVLSVTVFYSVGFILYENLELIGRRLK